MLTTGLLRTGNREFLRHESLPNTYKDIKEFRKKLEKINKTTRFKPKYNNSINELIFYVDFCEIYDYPILLLCNVKKMFLTPKSGERIMRKLSGKALSLPKMFSDEALESNIDRFNAIEHIRHFKLVYGKVLGEKLRDVTTIMDNGRKKWSKSHREYGHNRKFILKKFTTKEKKICAYVHLLGDFLQETLRKIIVDVAEEFKKGKIKGPFYEKFKDGKWGWDIKKNAIEKLIKDTSSTFKQTLKSKNRIGGLHCE